MAQTDNSAISPGSRKDAGPSGGLACTPNTTSTASSTSSPNTGTSVSSSVGQGIRHAGSLIKAENHAQDASESMSQISGFRRSLSHANSLPGGESVPKFGVSTEKEPELAEVLHHQPYTLCQIVTFDRKINKMGILILLIWREIPKS